MLQIVHCKHYTNDVALLLHEILALNQISDKVCCTHTHVVPCPLNAVVLHDSSCCTPMALDKDGTYYDPFLHYVVLNDNSSSTQPPPRLHLYNDTLRVFKSHERASPGKYTFAKANP